VLVVRDAADLSADVMRALGEGRYSGAAALARSGKGAAINGAVTAADQTGLFVLARSEGEVR
jgi:hypothetical protein